MSEDAIVLDIAGLVQQVYFNEVASVTWLLYDTIISLDEEIELIWKSANTPPKYLYFFSRYFGLFAQMTLACRMLPLSCVPSLLWCGFAFTTVILSVETSLMLRIYALYGRSRTMLYVLCLSFCGELTFIITLGSFAWPHSIHLVTPFPPEWHVSGCYYPTPPSFYKACWVPILSFESLLFGLCMYKCAAYGPLREVPILARIVRDGTVYFAVIFVTMIVCVLAPYIAEVFLEDVGSIWVSAIFSYSGSHLLLSIRALAAQRRQLEVLTPIISENIPVIASGTHRDSDSSGKAPEGPDHQHAQDPPSPPHEPSLAYEPCLPQSPSSPSLAYSMHSSQSHSPRTPQMPHSPLSPPPHTPHAHHDPECGEPPDFSQRHEQRRERRDCDLEAAVDVDVEEVEEVEVPTPPPPRMDAYELRTWHRQPRMSAYELRAWHDRPRMRADVHVQQTGARLGWLTEWER